MAVEQTGDYVVVQVTVPDEEAAKLISRALVEGRLAACVQRFPIASVYRWQGEVTEDAEQVLLIKTKHELFDKIIETVRELHSYEVPEMLALPVLAGWEPYLRWIDESTGEE